MQVEYPFEPKSTAFLIPGQFWSIPTGDGNFACGRVLQLKSSSGKKDSRSFLAGLMDYFKLSPPTEGRLAGSKLIAHGQVHIRTIAASGSQVLGHRSLELDAITIPLTLDQSPGPHCRIRRGFELLDLASASQQADLPVFSTWGYNVIINRACKLSQHAG